MPCDSFPRPCVEKKRDDWFGDVSAGMSSRLTHFQGSVLIHEWCLVTESAVIGILKGQRRRQRGRDADVRSEYKNHALSNLSPVKGEDRQASHHTRSLRSRDSIIITTVNFGGSIPHNSFIPPIFNLGIPLQLQPPIQDGLLPRQSGHRPPPHRHNPHLGSICPSP